MDHLTRHCWIQSAILSPRKMNRRSFEISKRSLQCNNFSSEAFLGVVNVNATNVLGKSQYFVDRSRCTETFLSKLKLEWQWNIALIHCRPHMLSKWHCRSQWWRFGKERQHNTAKIIPIHQTQIGSALQFG